MTIQVLGLCRFSLVSEGAFQVTHASLDERRAFLYDPARLAQRFAWFENVLLPGMAAQSDPDFRLIVLTGADFPQDWRDRLQARVAGIPQVVLDFRAPGKHRDLCHAAVTERIDPAAEVVAQFRLDDDDAVALDYVARIRSDFDRHLRPLYRRNSLLSVDNAKGLVLDASRGGVNVHQVMTHNWTPGLTLYLPPDHDKSVLDYPHHRLLSHMPGVSLQEEIMYVRGKHGANDSKNWGRAIGAAMDPARAARILHAGFGIDLPAFAAALAALPPAGTP